MTFLKIALGISVLFAFGCESNYLEKHFGETFQETTRQMVANPDAGKQPDDGITELEGETVENVMSQYRRGQTIQKSDSMPNSIVISSGTGK